MKFARLLRTTSEDLPEMESLFLSYKQLKKQLKLLPYKAQLETGEAGAGEALTAQENAFIAALSSTLAQMNEIFLEKEETSIIKVEHMERELAAASSPEELNALHKELVDFHGEVLLLVHWSILAYTATVKILKKHHKRTGLLLRAPHMGDLLSQPFCSTEVMTGLAHRLEDGIRSLADRMGITAQASGGAAPDLGSVGAVAPRLASSALSNAGVDMALLQRLADSESGDDTDDTGEGTGPSASSNGTVVATAAAHAGGGSGGGEASARPRDDAEAPPAACKRNRSVTSPMVGDAARHAKAPRAHAGGGPSVAAAAAATQPGCSGDGGGEGGDAGGDGAAASRGCASDGDEDGAAPPAVRVGSGGAPPGGARTSSILRQTQVALTTWQHLKTSASTPSTVIAAPLAAQAACSSVHTEASHA